MLRQKNIIRVPQNRHDFKIILLGETGAGKTSIIEKLCSKENVMCHFDCNVEIGLKELEFNDLMLSLKFYNMIDNSRKNISWYKQIVNQFYRDATIIIIVFDLTQPDYTENIQQWISEAERYQHLFDNKFKILCLGTKSDKKSSKHFIEQSEKLNSQINIISSEMRQNIYYYEVSGNDCESCTRLLDQIKIYANTIINEKKGP